MVLEIKCETKSLVSSLDVHGQPSKHVSDKQQRSPSGDKFEEKAVNTTEDDLPLPDLHHQSESANHAFRIFILSFNC